MFESVLLDDYHPARAEYLAQILRESKGGKSPIDDLPPERQQTLYQLAETLPLTVLAKMIAQPEPVGWNFKTTDVSLRRFVERYRKTAQLSEHVADLAQARAALEQLGADADEQTIMSITRRLMKLRLYRLAASPQGSIESMERITRTLDRQRRTDLAERRIHLQEKRGAQPSSE